MAPCLTCGTRMTRNTRIGDGRRLWRRARLHPRPGARPRWAIRGRAGRGRRAGRGDAVADGGRGDLALQPHRRPRPRALRRRAARHAHRGGRGGRLRDHRRGRLEAFPAVPDVDTPDLFAELNARVPRPVVVHDPAGRVRRRSRSSSTTTSAVGRRRSRAWSSTPARTPRSRSSSASRRPTRNCSPCRSCTCGPGGRPACSYLAVNELSHRGVADRPPPGVRRRRLVDHPGAPSPSAATTPGCAPKPGSSGAAAHQAARPVLRRRRADARLPHDPGPRRPAHDQRPAVQGRRAGLARPACTRG